MALSSSVNGICLLENTICAVSITLSILCVVKPTAPPHEKDGIKFLGNPEPKIFDATPTTVPVLNIVLIPHLEWSPMMRPQN